jgi:hypothetical protein
MSGPIVRTGTTPEFWKNWDRAFGSKAAENGDKKKTGASAPKAAKKAAKKAVKSPAKKAATKKKK